MKTTTKKGLKSLKKRAWTLFSKYIRLRDCLKTTGTTTHGVCITCGKTYPIESLQAGHFIAGRCNAILFDEEMTHAQCYACNVGLHGNVLEYRRKIIEMYGEGYDEILEIKSKQTRKFTVIELEEFIESLNKRIQNIGADNGGDR
jgi:hypothetical protein